MQRAHARRHFSFGLAPVLRLQPGREAALLRPVIGRFFDHAAQLGEDPKYAATFTVLCEYVEHHVKEEENEMFPKLRRARVNLPGLGKKLLAAKIRLAR